jgi:hypothetical protein
MIGWPSTLLVGIVIGLFYRRLILASLIAFVGTGLAWMLMALIPSIWSPSWLMAAKLIQISELSSDYAILLFILTGIIGGLLGLLGAASMVLISNLVDRKETFS